MSRPKNPNNVYELIDAVTGKSIPTNPKQFRDLMSRYNLTHAELLTSYVGQEGRNKLKNDNETVNSAINKYGLHPNVARVLKALRNNKTVSNNVSISVEVPTDAIRVEMAEPVETEPVEQSSKILETVHV